LPLVLHIPAWLTVLTISRDVIIALSVLIIHLQTQHSSFPPSLLEVHDRRSTFDSRRVYAREFSIEAGNRSISASCLHHFSLHDRLRPSLLL
jgi:hypothetical protein